MPGTLLSSPSKYKYAPTRGQHFVSFFCFRRVCMHRRSNIVTAVSASDGRTRAVLQSTCGSNIDYDSEYCIGCHLLYDVATFLFDLETL